MADALVGHSGFVGTTLLRQRPFDALYRSTNIAQIAGRDFDTVVCAAAPAQKWIANRDPEGDRRTIEGLMRHLQSMRCASFILISTVDVFGRPVGVDESSRVEEDGLHSYGLHRRMLERFVEERFADRLIVRLPGLIGPGLRKNALFDLHNDNNLQAVDSRGIFQFYPMVNLWYDIETARAAKLGLVHLTAEPFSIAEAAREGFGRAFGHSLQGTPAAYDFRTRHAGVFGAEGAYQYRKRDVIQAIRAYAQSEPLTKKATA